MPEFECGHDFSGIALLRNEAEARRHKAWADRVTQGKRQLCWSCYNKDPPEAP